MNVSFVLHLLGSRKNREKETGPHRGASPTVGNLQRIQVLCSFYRTPAWLYQLENNLFFTTLTLSHSQMFLVSLCPHLVLALDFDFFAPSPSLVFTLVSLFLRNLSCPLFQHNLWQDQFQLASAASVTPQSFPWYSGSFILLSPFGRLRKAGHLEVRPWASHLPTLASVSTSVKREGVPDLLVLSQADVL